MLHILGQLEVVIGCGSSRFFIFLHQHDVTPLWIRAREWRMAPPQPPGQSQVWKRIRIGYGHEDVKVGKETPKFEHV